MHNLEHAGWICHSVDHCCASGGHCACLGAADIFNIDQQHVAAVETMADNSRRLNWPEMPSSQQVEQGRHDFDAKGFAPCLRCRGERH
jgi:hypothetical protein